MSLLIAMAASWLGAAPDSGHIAYLEGDRPEALAVAVLDLADGESRRLGEGPYHGAPAWAPGGESLACSAETEAGRRIEILPFDGGEPTAPPHALPYNEGPVWSEDGRRLAYAARDDAGALRIAVYDTERETERFWGPEERRFAAPAWLHADAVDNLFNALRQVFAGAGALRALEDSARTGGALLAVEFTADAEGLSATLAMVCQDGAAAFPTALLRGEGRYVEWAPASDPAGRGIAFDSNDGGDREIYYLAFDKGLLNVSNHFAGDWNPVWRPQGGLVAFESFRSGRRGLYRVMPDTARVEPLAVFEDGQAWAPAWRDDGAWVAFTGDPEGSPDLYAVPAEGGRPERLTESPGIETMPAWRPAPAP